jgi:hypothetical protein
MSRLFSVCAFTACDQMPHDSQKSGVVGFGRYVKGGEENATPGYCLRSGRCNRKRRHDFGRQCSTRIDTHPNLSRRGSVPGGDLLYCGYAVGVQREELQGVELQKAVFDRGDAADDLHSLIGFGRQFDKTA